MIKYIEGTVVRVTRYDGRGMRKHAGFRHERSAFEQLDAIAHVRVTPMGVHGLVIRKSSGAGL